MRKWLGPDQAGVAKTTVYRRWPTKDHLAVAMVARMLGEVPIPDTGDLGADLATFAATLAAQLTKARSAGLEPGNERSAGLIADLTAAAARHADIGEAVRAGYARRHALAVARLTSAIDRKQVKDSIDPGPLVEQVVGPIYYRILITGEPVDRSYTDRLVASVLDGALRPGTQRRSR